MELNNSKQTARMNVFQEAHKHQFIHVEILVKLYQAGLLNLKGIFYPNQCIKVKLSITKACFSAVQFSCNDPHTLHLHINYDNHNHGR